MIHRIIRGLILYRMEIRFSIESNIVSINARTNTQEPIMPIISKNCLFHWYINVKVIIIDTVIGTINKIRFDVFMLNITENLLIT